jgi:hypothetical protein
MNEVTAKDPAHFTERALHASACWQVWCQQRLILAGMAAEVAFAGERPLADVTRFGQEISRQQLKETYARMKLQHSLDWLVSGIDFAGDYDHHVAELWGDDICEKLRKWWRATYEPYYTARIEAHARELAEAPLVAQSVPTEETTADPR